MQDLILLMGEKGMDDLVKLERAKRYIDKLAKGIDPINNREMTEDTLLSNACLSRCFFYVSEVLGDLISSGSVKATEKSTAFYISQKQKSEVTLSPECYISYFVDRINSAAAPNYCKRLSRIRLYTWLVTKGFMSEFPAGDKVNRKVTQAGEQIGIRTERRENSRGFSYVTILSKRAQAFIIDNLGALIAETEELEENPGKAWTPEEDILLKDLYQRKNSVNDIGFELGRTRSGIRRRLKKLGMLGNDNA
jgi:hypothetical protein